MTLGWKLVIDSADPQHQAAFWSEALGYELEDNSRLVERLLEQGVIDESVSVDFQGRKFFRDATATRHPEDPFDPDSGTGLGRRLLFVRVPEPKTGKNRLHIDVHSGPAGRAATVARLESLGATLIRHVEEAQGQWSVLTDPEGNEFCVA